jgi:hypothetical protein
MLFVSATLMTHGNAAVVVSSAFRCLLFQQGRVWLALVQARRLYADNKTAPSRSRFRFMQ